MDILWSPESLEDVLDILDYLEPRNAVAALKQIARIEKNVLGLRKNPALGRAGHCPGTRELVIPRTKYIVVYQVNKKNIEILRVYHSAQDWMRV